MSNGLPGRPPKHPGTLQIVLDWIEVTDSMDLDGVGEFRFLFRLRSNFRGLIQDTLLPEEGVLSIPEKATHNHVGPLDLVVYEGHVEVGEVLTLEITGEEVDYLSPNDQVEWYEREFEGDPATWHGPYSPWDEGSQDPEKRKQWRLGYRVHWIADADTEAATANR